MGIEPVPLSDLLPGMKAVMISMEVNGCIRRRLLDLGFIPGAEVEAVLKSPSGDSAAYSIRGAVIALRKGDAARILVRALESEGRVN